jgi:hypothetical protein
VTLRDVDEYSLDDSDDGWFGRAQTVEPIPSPDVEDLPREDDSDAADWEAGWDTADWDAADSDGVDPDVADSDAVDPDAADTDRWHVPAADPAVVEPTRIEVIGMPAPASWESRLSSSGAWDFKLATPDPWYRSKRTLLTTMIVATTAVAAVALVGRSPAPVVEDSSIVSPNQSNSSPTPTNTAPATASDAPAPPLGPPLPPLPSAQEINTPNFNRDYQPRRRSAPDARGKPEIGVTRTPVTRAPLSATPPPPPPQDRNSSTPGDAPRRRGFF